MGATEFSRAWMCVLDRRPYRIRSSLRFIEIYAEKFGVCTGLLFLVSVRLTPGGLSEDVGVCSVARVWSCCRPILIAKILYRQEDTSLY